MRRGVTLFELVLVMAVLVLITAIAVPSIDAMYGRAKITAAADAIRGAWARARAHAINDGRPYRFGIVPGTGSYRIAPDGAEFWGGGQSSGGSGPAQPLVVNNDVPKGVLLNSPPAGGGGSPASADASGYVPVVIFLPDGTARDDVKMVIGTGRGRSLVLKLRSLTGAVTTDWVNQ